MSGERLTLAYFCATYLKPEMRHIYRQVTGQSRYRPIVLAQKLENLGAFPFDPIHVIRRSSLRPIFRMGEHRLGGGPWQISPGEARRMVAAIEAEDARFLHVFFGTAAVHLLPLFRRLKVPLVISFHGADVAGSIRSRRYATAVAEMFDRAARVTARSQALLDEVEQMGCPREKLTLQRTTVPLPDGAELPANPENGAWRIIQAARLIPKKGIEFSLRAFSEFRRSAPNARLVIAGEGPLRKELESLAAALEVSDAVEFTGFLDQAALQGRLEGSHVYLHPSQTVQGRDQEGVPNAMLEAMAFGLPVVATCHGGIPEAVRNGQDGILVPEGDVDAIVRALCQITGQPAAYKAFSVSAQERVRTEFSEQTDVYEDLVGTAQCPTPLRK